MTSFPRSKKVKLDWFPFYARDWISDPAVSALSATGQGVWIRLLCTMYLQNDASVTGTSRILARIANCTEAEIDAFIADARILNLANIAESNGCVTITSRRALYEIGRREKIRDSGRSRSARFRENNPSNAQATGKSRSTVTDTITEEKNITKAPASPEFDFEEFWKLYPRREHRQGAERSWGKLKANEQQAAMSDVPKRRRANWDGREIKHIPHAATYLNQKQWLDELVSPGAVNGTSPYGPPKPRELVAPISQEQRLENVRRLRELTAGIGK